MAAGVGEQAARRRAGALLAASVLLHLAVLGPLSLRWIVGPPPVIVREQPVVLLDIAPRPLLPDERPRPPAAAAVPLPDPAAGRPAASRPEAPRVRLRPEEETDRAFQAPEAPAGVAVPRDWSVQPEATGDRMARALRNSGVGCRLRRESLTAAEREACDEAFGTAAARAAPITGSGDARRDARFAAEGARALAQYEARRRGPSGGVGVSGASPDCVGGNLRSTCAGAHLPSQYQRPEENFVRSGRSAPQ
ncbi:MAG TPA: hypothetical protein VGN74_14530 [Brevundimonas sp.]|jgi:hypothetical protein|uniref:hypothetical protein n=1 Tax=Brevundimonas sp. TaxID=1871086 RepID=UPI002E0E5D45|nr:hypothetical protein [Brevundimonas sp.]